MGYSLMISLRGTMQLDDDDVQTAIVPEVPGLGVNWYKEEADESLAQCSRPPPAGQHGMAPQLAPTMANSQAPNKV